MPRANPASPHRGGDEDRLALVCAVALAVGFVAMLWRMAVEPVGHGYVRYAGIALRMVTDGDWVALRLGDELYLDKPPLYVWAIAAPMALLGRVSGWMPHVPNVLGAGLALFWTGRLAARVFPERWAAWAAPALLASTWLFHALVRGKRIDPLFAAWLTGAFTYAHALVTGPRAGTGRAAAVGACLAAATLTKGPLALLFFGAGIVPFLLWERARVPARPVIVGLAVYAVIVAPWPLLLARELGPANLWHALAGNGFTSREAGPLHYLIRLPVAMAPWSVLLPALVAWLLLERPWRASRDARFLLCWVLGIVVPLELSPVRHSRYLLPAYPALAILLVALWAPLRARVTTLPTRPVALTLRNFGTALLPATVGVAGAGAALTVGLWGGRVDIPALVPALAGAGLAVTALGLLLVEMRHPRRGVRLGAAACLALVTLALLDGLRGWDLGTPGTPPSTRTVAELLSADPGLAGAFGLGERARVTVGLAAGEAIEPLDSPGELSAWLARAEGARWVVTPADGADAIPLPPGYAVVRRIPLETGGREPLAALRLAPRRRSQPSSASQPG